MSRKFSYKVENGILYFHYREALRPIYPVRIYKVLGSKTTGKKKLDAMFKKAFNPSGENSLILFFRNEFMAVLDETVNRAPVYLKKGYKEAVEGFRKVIDNIDVDTRPYKLDMKKMEEDSKFPAMKHQLKAFKDYQSIMTNPDSRGMLLDAAPGTGKTYMSLTMSRGMDIDTVLIIAPLQTIDNVWVASLNGEKQVFKFKVDPYLVKDNKCYDYVAPKDKDDKKYIIANYEKLEMVIQAIPQLRLGKRTLVIVDESHNFGDPKSSRTMLLRELIVKLDPDNMLLLSGTPVKAKTKEILNIANLLNRNFLLYENRINVLYGRIGNAGFSGALTNFLSEEYKRSSTNIIKDNIQLPDLHYKKITVNLGSEGKQFTLEAIGEELRAFTVRRQKELERELPKYEKIHQDFFKEYYIGSSSDRDKYFEYIKKMKRMTDREKLQNMEMLVFCKKVEQELNQVLTSPVNKLNFKECCSIVKFLNFKVRGEALGQLYVRRKIDCYKAIIRKMDFSKVIDDSEKKTVIFSSYIENCDAVVENLLKDKRYEPIQVYGNSSKNLDKNVKLFNDPDTEYNPLVTTFASLSTGVELKGASSMILIDLPYRAAELDQTVARIHRQGQDAECFVYIIDLDTGSDKNIAQRTVDIIKYYDQNVLYLTGHGSYQDLDNLNYGDDYTSHIRFESDIRSGDTRTMGYLPVSRNPILQPVKYLKNHYARQQIEGVDETTLRRMKFLNF